MLLLIFTVELKLSGMCTSSHTFATVCEYCVNAVFTTFALLVNVL